MYLFENVKNSIILLQWYHSQQDHKQVYLDAIGGCLYYIFVNMIFLILIILHTKIFDFWLFIWPDIFVFLEYILSRIATVSHVSLFYLIVYLTWLSVWHDCLFDLTVYLTSLSVWPVCLFDLTVYMTWLSTLPDCPLDLTVHLT